jgi:hypothetical protein
LPVVERICHEMNNRRSQTDDSGDRSRLGEDTVLDQSKYGPHRKPAFQVGRLHSHTRRGEQFPTKEHSPEERFARLVYKLLSSARSVTTMESLLGSCWNTLMSRLNASAYIICETGLPCSLHFILVCVLRVYGDNLDYVSPVQRTKLNYNTWKAPE